MTPQESLSLLSQAPDEWREEADKPGNGWMDFQLFEMEVATWLDSQGIPEQTSPSLCPLNSEGSMSVPPEVPLSTRET